MRRVENIFPWARWLALVALLIVSGCGDTSPAPDILLITLDTTRADRLGSYGYNAAETPALDGLAATGVRFDRAHAQVPLTLPSHVSLLTGTYPRVNGVHVNAEARLGNDLPTLAEGLKQRGYRTAAFVSAFVLDAVFGLDRGFDVYDDEMGVREQSERFEAERSADRVVDAALAWLDRESAEPTFAWVHFYDPHTPYDPPPEYAARLADPYDGEIAFVDAQIARLVRWLEESGKRDNTLIVVAGDHGESLGEHAETEHGLFVYGSTIRVPMILSWPARLPAGTVATADVQLLDLYPTILELTGAPPGGSSDGESLVELLRGRQPGPRAIYGASRYGEIGYGWAPLRFMIHDGWKYIEAPRPELYDLDSDPGETSNLVDDQAAKATELREWLTELEAQLVPHDSDDVDLDSEALAKIESLGYVAGSTHTTSADVDLSSLRDPKDMAGVLRDHYRAVGMVRQGRFERAIEVLEELVRRSPESIDLYEDLGWSYSSVGRYADAEQAYEKSLTNLPDHAERRWGLAETQRRQGKYDAAKDNYERALAHRPSFGEAHMGLTLVYSEQGEFETALAHAHQHAKINPASPIAWLNVLNLAMELERYDDALVAVDRLAALDPGNPRTGEIRNEINRRRARQ